MIGLLATGRREGGRGIDEKRQDGVSSFGTVVREAGESGTAAVVAGGLGHKYRQVWMEIGDTRKGAGVWMEIETRARGRVWEGD